MLSQSIIVRLRHQHETLTELLEGCSEEALRRRAIPGKWSIFEQSAHLAAYQPTFYARLQQMESVNGPSFERYVADNDPHFQECCQKSLSELLDYLNKERAVISRHLLSLTEMDLQRSGRHPKYGLMDVGGWTEFFLLHEAHHLFSIFMLAREMNIYAQQA
jgi:uncharacterized damage-inducible protein DinB